MSTSGHLDYEEFLKLEEILTIKFNFYPFYK
jgi:hypothetical protein